MALPAFTDDGVLPDGIHLATVDEVRDRFVTAFEGAAARRDVFERWLRHRDALRELVEVPAQRLCGSFVTDKHAPNDLDVVTELDGPTYDELPEHRQLLVSMLVRGNYTEQLWRVDAWPTFTYPERHRGREIATSASRWLHDHFGTGRDGERRGIVEVRGDDS